VRLLTLDCPAMSDDKSVLGNLPRSRPGTRSDKRRNARPADAAEAAAKASETGPPAARPKPKPKAVKPTAAKPKAAAKPRPARPVKAPPPPEPAREPVPDPDAPAPAASDPLGDAARVAAKAVGTGVKIGTGLAQEVLRRLPRR
jgi:outer membrane biosynthesis protein TonB